MVRLWLFASLVLLWLVGASPIWGLDLTSLPRGAKISQTINNKTRTYTVIERLGNGQYGTVYKVVDANQDVWAIKLITKANFHERHGVHIRAFLRQKAFQESEHILKYEYTNATKVVVSGEAIESGPSLRSAVIEPLVRYRDAFSLVGVATMSRDERLIRVRRATKLFLQLLSGLEDISRAGYNHRDVKPANVGLTGPVDDFDWGGAVAQLIDIDLLVPTNDPSADENSGSLIYMAPEYYAFDLLGQHSDYATLLTDVYALGSSIFELVAEDPPRRFGYVERKKAEGEPDAVLGRDAFVQVNFREAYESIVMRSVREFFARIATAIDRDPEATATDQRELALLEALVTRALSRSPADRYAALTADDAPFPESFKSQLKSEPIDVKNFVSGRACGLLDAARRLLRLSPRTAN